MPLLGILFYFLNKPLLTKQPNVLFGM